MKYIDIHSHLNFSDYGEDFGAVIMRMEEASVGTIAIGTDLETSVKAVELAHKHQNIWACIGVHPVDNPSRAFEEENFRELVKHPKVVAVGECGLDFFHADKAADFDRQKKLFLEHINFALEFDKPIMIHSRSAYPELLEILEPLKEIHGDKLRGNVHFFAGTLEEAKRFWVIGFTTSFTGVITFARNYDEVIKNAPLEMLQAETDAPFVAPAPYRGQRNEPAYVVEVVKKIAELRGEEEDTVRKALLENAHKLFQLA